MENLEDWRKACKMSAQAREYGLKLIKKGSSLLEVSDKIEKKIFDLGGRPAFPVQLSCDHLAAHYCADPDDQTVFDNQLVCLDLGVHVNGAIGDNAGSVDLSGEHSDIVKASKKALEEASKILQVGIPINEIGRTIQETIQSFNLSPIKNLSGHGLDLYQIHTSPSIPNFDNNNTEKLKKGQVIAIEPFATNGAGMIYETERANIFALKHSKPVRSPFARQVLMHIKEEYNTLPFTTRWITKKFGEAKTNLALKELLNKGILDKFPPLAEKNKGLVSQAENTFLIEDKVEVLTRV